jgi:phenylacetate-CoA ligase
MKEREYLKEFYKQTFHLHHWTMTSKSIDYWDEFESSQWHSIEQLKELQFKKLQKLLSYANKNVPYYRQLFLKNKISPLKITDYNDFNKIPILTKETLKSEKSSVLLSEKANKDKVLLIRTSGSTGMPLHIYADIGQLDSRYAAVLRSWRWAGWEFGDKSIRLWHQTIGMNDDQIKREWLDALLLSRKFLPVFELDDKNLMKYILEIESFKPKLMDGYAEAFDILARFIMANDIDDVHVPSIVTSAQMLTCEMRSIINKAMHTEVFDRYGCREFSTIGHECDKHAGYHINAENLFVEIIKNGRPAKIGEIGEIVITDLNNFCQPLIRYSIGDLAEKIPETCPCGRGLPLIGKIFGRTKGVIIGLNGRYLTTAFFLHYLKDFDNEIRQFQIIQEERDLVNVKLIPNKKTIKAEILKRIENEFKHYLGEGMKIEFFLVEKIEMVKTGKHQAVLSKINLEMNESVNLI